MDKNEDFKKDEVIMLDGDSVLPEFPIESRVFLIENNYCEVEVGDCRACNGKGIFELKDGRTITCTECNGRGSAIKKTVLQKLSKEEVKVKGYRYTAVDTAGGSLAISKDYLLSVVSNRIHASNNKWFDYRALFKSAEAAEKHCEECNRSTKKYLCEEYNKGNR